jgi:hypothetical protein
MTGARAVADLDDASFGGGDSAILDGNIHDFKSRSRSMRRSCCCWFLLAEYTAATNTMTMATITTNNNNTAQPSKSPGR